MTALQGGRPPHFERRGDHFLTLVGGVKGCHFSLSHTHRPGYVWGTWKDLNKEALTLQGGDQGVETFFPYISDV